MSFINLKHVSSCKGNVITYADKGKPFESAIFYLEINQIKKELCIKINFFVILYFCYFLIFNWS